MLGYRPTELQLKDSKNYGKDIDTLKNRDLESNKDGWLKLELFLLLRNTHDYSYLDLRHDINIKISKILLDKYYKPHLENKEMENYEWAEISNFWWGPVNNMTWEVRGNSSKKRWEEFNKHIKAVSKYLYDEIEMKIDFALSEDALKVEWYEYYKYFDLENYKQKYGL